MKISVFLPHTFNASYSADIVVGVDYGAYQLAKNNISMDIAIGDFDSVNSEEFLLIKKHAKEIIKLNTDKNETDSEAAIMYLKNLGYNDITIYNDLGERFDHLLINYRLVEKYNVTLISKNSKTFLLEKGRHQIKNTHKYLSLFTNNECKLSLANTLYPLDNVLINFYDTYLTSNKIIDEYAILNIDYGSLIVVLSSDN